MRNKKFIYVAIIMMCFSCSYNSEDDLIDSTPIPELVTYENDVKTIIDNNCISCHGNPPTNGAPNPLTTFIEVKDAIQNNGLINRISTNDLGLVMPFGGPRLPQNLIDIVIQWEANGLLEN